MDNRVFVIAEAGVNHNGDIKLAKQLIDVAKNAGADAVKFQTWKTELLVTCDAELADYQAENIQSDETQYEMLKKLELSYNEFGELKNYCDSIGIMFLSTPDEEESASFLSTLQDRFKIGSGELTNLPFLRHIASFGKPIILSTGMGTLGEVETAIVTLLESGITSKQLTVLHATTDYPTAYKDVNLRAMETIRAAFPGVAVGYSDHTLGVAVAIAATALGAKVIEKHFTLDKDMAGPDHKASLCPAELNELVRSIRNTEAALGDGVKRPVIAELEHLKIVRKVIVAAQAIEEGQILTSENMTLKRASEGISPARWGEVLGTKALRAYREGEPI